MRLPLNFFDSHLNGDILQRIQDQKRVETFLTGTALNTLFSLISVIVFTVAISYYDTIILFIFLLSTVFYAGWILLFMNKRRELDIMRFDSLSSNQSNIIELIGGIQEIKLHNIEQHKRWQWERNQARLFKFNVRSLAINQYQQAGSSFINQGKNIIISFVSATAVIDGDLTLGGMLAIQFIVGQLNSPIEQLLALMQGFQDTKISLERLSDVHKMIDEEPADKELYKSIPADKSIRIRGLKFTYPGAGNEPVLHDIDLDIPEGKTTAIVGMSGSGKTTLLKLLLRFYAKQEGEIKIGGVPLDQISFRAWRDQCGTVLQDGYIFSDTIAANIAMGDHSPNLSKLDYAASMACISGFISDLPLGYNTKIGSFGNGISQGQRQRILIARTIYKNSHYVLFDEATNALDANNESRILENMKEFLQGKTVVVVAHRLSSVKNADHIVVLDKGRIVERGCHATLTSLKGAYYNLIKNQLELGSS